MATETIYTGPTASGEAVRVLARAYALRDLSEDSAPRPIVVGPADLDAPWIVAKLREAYEAGFAVAVTDAEVADIDRLHELMSHEGSAHPGAEVKQVALAAVRRAERPDGQLNYGSHLLAATRRWGHAAPIRPSSSSPPRRESMRATIAAVTTRRSRTSKSIELVRADALRAHLRAAAADRHRGEPVVRRARSRFTIQGTGLYPSLVEAVLIGGTAVDATNVQTTSDTEIEVIAPDTNECRHEAGCAVAVQTTEGTSNTNVNVVIRHECG
ncbi:MAG TPA: hypothetical protein VIS07_11310 [Candidatus Binatia bacterium]